jgi:hypothetical protein
LSISEFTSALPEADRNNGYAAVEITTRNAPSASAANSVGVAGGIRELYARQGCPAPARGSGSRRLRGRGQSCSFRPSGFYGRDTL